MELEGDQYNVRFMRADLYTGLRCCVIFEIAARRKLKPEQNEIVLLCCPLSMCLYCGTICCFCDTYPRYAKHKLNSHHSLVFVFLDIPIRDKTSVPNALTDGCRVRLEAMNIPLL